VEVTSISTDAVVYYGGGGAAIGRDGDNAAWHFNGLIDDVRIYNYARTPEEIRLDYNAGLAARLGPHSGCDEDPGSCMTKGLVGYWNFDEAGGTTAYDGSDYGNDGTLYNNPAWTAGAPAPGGGSQGTALQFDGVDDYVDCGNDVSLNPGTSDFTWEGWFKTSSNGPIYTKGEYK
jgi:hypothetical protein